MDSTAQRLNKLGLTQLHIRRRNQCTLQSISRVRNPLLQTPVSQLLLNQWDFQVILEVIVWCQKQLALLPLLALLRYSVKYWC